MCGRMVMLLLLLLVSSSAGCLLSLLKKQKIETKCAVDGEIRAFAASTAAAAAAVSPSGRAEREREELKIASALAACQLLVREPPITGQHFRMLAGWLSAYYHRLTTTVSPYQQQQWPSLSEHCCCVLELVHGCMQIRLRREDIKSSQQKNTYVQLAIRRLTSHCSLAHYHHHRHQHWPPFSAEAIAQEQYKPLTS